MHTQQISCDNNQIHKEKQTTLSVDASLYAEAYKTNNGFSQKF